MMRSSALAVAPLPASLLADDEFDLVLNEAGQLVPRAPAPAHKAAVAVTPQPVERPTEGRWD